MSDETTPRLVILLNDGVKMSRGKRAAQAVHAALIALNVHGGWPVIVLGATRTEIETCPVVVRDAGYTELAPGTLTAGIREVPGGPDSREWPLHLVGERDRPSLVRSHAQDAHLVALHQPGDPHLIVTVRLAALGTFIARCTCGKYRSDPYVVSSDALRCGLAHATDAERVDSAR